MRRSDTRQPTMRTPDQQERPMEVPLLVSLWPHRSFDQTQFAALVFDRDSVRRILDSWRRIPPASGTVSLEGCNVPFRVLSYTEIAVSPRRPILDDLAAIHAAVIGDAPLPLAEPSFFAPFACKSDITQTVRLSRFHIGDGDSCLVAP